MLPSAGARAPPAPTKGTAEWHIAPPDRARAPTSLPPQCALPSRTGIRPRGKASMLGLALLCHLSAVSAQQRLAVNVECLPYRSDEALVNLSGAKLPNCSPHRPPTERARIVQWPVPQMRSCCTTTWAALPVPTARHLRLVSVTTPSDAQHRCRSSATSALLASIPTATVRHWTTCAIREWVRAGPEPTRSPLGPACPSAHLARRAQSSETSSPPRVPPPWGPVPSTCTLRTPRITPIGCAPPPEHVPLAPPATEARTV